MLNIIKNIRFFVPKTTIISGNDTFFTNKTPHENMNEKQYDILNFKFDFKTGNLCTVLLIIVLKIMIVQYTK